MSKNLYAIRDIVARDLLTLQCYQLLTFNSDQQAARYFADGVNDTSSIINRHPADYELVHVGTVDHLGNITPNGLAETDEQGNKRFVPLEPRVICRGDALLTGSNQGTAQPTN